VAYNAGETVIPRFDAAEVVDRFAGMLRVLMIDGVSDIHFAGGDAVWPVQYGRPTRSTFAVSNQDIVVWAELFGKKRGGGKELVDGDSGSLECMAQISVGGHLIRLRMTYRRQAAGLAMTLRIVPEKPPRLTDAVFHRNPVPRALADLTLNTPAGLILFCGPTGSGKTTMNAALLSEVNHTQNKHIYTVEDPIEFTHESKMSIVSQREIGDHADSFPRALRTSLRARPNIILVGELLDLETVRVAIEAANKGHLVFATSHAGSAEEAVSSLVSQFPGSEQNQIATALAQALKAICVQRLVPTVDGKIVPARELLLNNVAVSSKIRERNFSQITQALKPTDNMWSFEDDLAFLWARGDIDEVSAMKYANDRKVLGDKLRHAQANRQAVAAGTHQTYKGGMES
jgi:pilus retraction protein PilT